MASVPPLYDQVREGSARVRARERALAWLGRPSYRVAAAAGTLSGIGSAVVISVERRLPSLMSLPQLSLRQTLVEVLYRAAIGAALALCAAALVRFARWTYFRVRFGVRAT